MKKIKLFTIVISILLSCPNPIFGQCNYCSPQIMYYGAFFINNVTFGTLNNSSAADPNGYGDYTSLSTTIETGSIQAISVNVGSNTYTEYVTVWFDWNKDCDFDDAGETYYIGTGQGTADVTISADIYIPASTPLGATRMRVSVGTYDGYPSACDPYDDYAETEDYTVIVTTGIPIDADRIIYVQPSNDIKMQNLGKELRDYLHRIDGKSYVIDYSENFPNTGILLAQRTATTFISPSENSTLSSMNKEAFLSDANDTRIKIIGNHHKAVSHGMFDFLKQLGCYFLSPSEDWTIIPNIPNWRLNNYKFDEPDFVYRNLWYANGDGFGYESILDKNHFDREKFFRATQQGGVGSYAVGHSYQGDLEVSPTEFQNHPEWFGTNQYGYQHTWQDYVDNGYNFEGILEYSDLNLADLMLQNRINWLSEYKKDNPDNFLVSMEPNDGSSPSYTPQAQALGNMSDQVLNLANYVANNITDSIPDAKIGIYCYGQSLEAPLNTIPASNIYGVMAMAFNGTDKSFNEMAFNWLNSGLNELGVYEYWGEYQWDLGMPHAHQAKFSEIKERIPYMHNAWGTKTLSVESQANWGGGGPAYYIARKLLWDTEADADALYDDYMTKAFGAAAASMKELYLDWEKGYPTRYNPAWVDHIMLNKWLTLIQQAWSEVQPGTPEFKRVEDIYTYVHYARLGKEFYEKQDEVYLNGIDTTIARDAALDWLKFGYRLRHRHIIQFWAFQHRLIFENPVLWTLLDTDPGWNYFEMDTNPTLWMDNGDDFTTAELQNMLAEDLQKYPVDPLVKTYTKDLVPLYPDLAPSLFIQQIEQMDTLHSYGVEGLSNWYFYSEDSHNVNIYNIKSNTAYLEYNDEIYTFLLTKADDQSIVVDHRPPVAYADGELDIDTVLNVPLNKGLYKMEMTNYGGNNYYFSQFDTPHRFVVEASHKHPLSLALAFQNPDVPKFESLYFYVPEDIDTVYLHQNYLLQIKAPSWTGFQNFYWDETGFLKIPVTNDMDRDTIWELGYSGTSTDNFFFLNIPPYLSNSPENMLVPNMDITGVSDAPSKMDFNIYPNPTNGLVEVSFPEDIDTQISVYNILGESVFQKKIKDHSVNLDLSHLPGGTYFIGFDTGERFGMGKVVLRK